MNKFTKCFTFSTVLASLFVSPLPSLALSSEEQASLSEIAQQISSLPKAYFESILAGGSYTFKNFCDDSYYCLSKERKVYLGDTYLNSLAFNDPEKQKQAALLNAKSKELNNLIRVLASCKENSTACVEPFKAALLSALDGPGGTLLEEGHNKLLPPLERIISHLEAVHRKNFDEKETLFKENKSEKEAVISVSSLSNWSSTNEKEDAEYVFKIKDVLKKMKPAKDPEVYEDRLKGAGPYISQSFYSDNMEALSLAKEYNIIWKEVYGFLRSHYQYGKSYFQGELKEYQNEQIDVAVKALNVNIIPLLTTEEKTLLGNSLTLLGNWEAVTNAATLLTSLLEKREATLKNIAAKKQIAKEEREKEEFFTSMQRYKDLQMIKNHYKKLLVLEKVHQALLSRASTLLEKKEEAENIKKTFMDLSSDEKPEGAERGNIDFPFVESKDETLAGTPVEKFNEAASEEEHQIIDLKERIKTLEEETSKKQTAEEEKEKEDFFISMQRYKNSQMVKNYHKQLLVLEKEHYVLLSQASALLEKKEEAEDIKKAFLESSPLEEVEGMERGNIDFPFVESKNETLADNNNFFTQIENLTNKLESLNKAVSEKEHQTIDLKEKIKMLAEETSKTSKK